MARFDVYSAPGKDAHGYALDVQADLLNDLETRVIVPLVSLGRVQKPIKGLNPVFEVQGRHFVMLTQFIGTMATKHLKNSQLSLKTRSDDITRALDILLSGF